MFYHNNQIGASCSYATSMDFKTWSYKGKVFTNYSITDSKGEKNDRRYSNCDGLVLSNGDILTVASYRANNGYRDLPKDAGIEMRRSTDNGVTWSEPVSVYQGVNWNCLREKSIAISRTVAVRVLKAKTPELQWSYPEMAVKRGRLHLEVSLTM